MGEHSAITQLNLTSARLALARLPAAPLGEALKCACKIASQALDTRRVGVWLFEPEAQQLRCICLYSPDGQPVPAPLPMADIPSYSATLREQRYLATRDAQVDPVTRDVKQYTSQHGIHSMLDAAIYRAGSVVGVVCHERQGPVREFKESECEFAVTVADIVAYLLESDQRLSLERQVHRLEVKLKDAQRIDAVSRFAAGIAHDLGNLLTVVTTGLQVLEKQGAAGDVVKMVREATNHGSALTRQLSRLTRGVSTDKDRQVLRGRDLKETWGTLLGAMLKAPWVVALDVDPEAQVWADAVQLEQVLLNLVFNARDAMANGGTILVRFKKHDEQFARIDVIDTGVGIPPEHVADVFAPYFTTKGDQGTGLGLSTVQFLAHEHGGRVDLSSAPGDGTTVTIYWPVSAPVTV
ncbi:MAG: GAF domain-containing protein [Myxococcaceae bacterium]|nr:GAF domain-containing protein [Myxococcaceae bacterium]